MVWKSLIIVLYKTDVQKNRSTNSLQHFIKQTTAQEDIYDQRHGDIVPFCINTENLDSPRNQLSWSQETRSFFNGPEELNVTIKHIHSFTIFHKENHSLNKLKSYSDQKRKDEKTEHSRKPLRRWRPNDKKFI